MTEGESKKLNAEEVKSRLKEKCTSIIDKVCCAIPDDVAEHLGNSKNELLMAVRSLIDDEIARTDKGVDRVKETKKED